MDNYIKKPLVSILVPCYNVEDKVPRLFDSLLRQTYDYLQIIVVNDGSIDQTEIVVLKYGEEFKAKGFEFNYVLQKNGGVAKACETGLSYVKGDFLCWPDADDFYNDDAVEKLLDFLLNHEEYNIVRCNANVFLESNLNSPIGKLAKNSKEDNLMLDYIEERDVYFAPVCFMARFSAVRKENPNLELFYGRTGQNYQMLLPLLRSSKFGFIEECLSNYLIFDGSISHKRKLTYLQRIERIEDKHNCIYETLKIMNLSNDEFHYYEGIAFQKLYTEKCIAAYDYGFKKQYRQLRSNVIDKAYIQKLGTPDSYLTLPFMFQLHHLFYMMKQRLKGDDLVYKAVMKFRNMKAAK